MHRKRWSRAARGHVYCDVRRMGERMRAQKAVAAIPTIASSPTWQQASEAFLHRDLAPGTRRVYRLTLEAVGSRLAAATLADVNSADLGAALGGAYPRASAA